MHPHGVSCRSLCGRLHPRLNQEGAGKAGRRLAPVAPAQKNAHAMRKGEQVEPEHPGLPCAAVWWLMPGSPWRRIPFVTIASRIDGESEPVGSTSPPQSLTAATAARTTRFYHTHQAPFVLRDANPSRTEVRPAIARRADACHVHRIPARISW